MKRTTEDINKFLYNLGVTVVFLYSIGVVDNFKAVRDRMTHRFGYSDKQFDEFMLLGQYGRINHN